jgi:hypothetical protein
VDFAVGLAGDEAWYPLYTASISVVSSIIVTSMMPENF